MVEELNFGVMVHITMESTGMVKNMVVGYTTGQMGHSMLVNGSRMRCMAKESSPGLMVGSIRVFSLLG